MTVLLDLRVHGDPMSFDVNHLVVAGFTGRDDAAVRRHIEELERDGIAAPDEVPTFYVLPPGLLTTSADVDVEGDRTCGEVEPVVFVVDGRMYAGVGSDHTDRVLEREEIYAAKAACPKVVARDVVPLEDIRDRWDDLLVRSHTTGGAMYQQAPLGELLPPEDVLRRIDGGPLDAAVVFLGTVPLLTQGFIFGGSFEGELVDTDGTVLSGFSYRIKRRART